jgi:hypothetical protein
MLHPLEWFVVYRLGRQRRQLSQIGRKFREIKHAKKPMISMFSKSRARKTNFFAADILVSFATTYVLCRAKTQTSEIKKPNVYAVETRVRGDYFFQNPSAPVPPYLLPLPRASSYLAFSSLSLHPLLYISTSFYFNPLIPHS